MQDKKYQVFISSTFKDLEKHRQLASKAILELEHIPIGMEMFTPSDETAWDYIKRQIDDSDYYLVIVAHRYGSMDGDISFTEKEYDYAREKNVPVIGFVIKEDAAWNQALTEKDHTIQDKLNAFKEKVKTKLVGEWEDEKDLYGKIGIALPKFMRQFPRTGWVRADETDYKNVAGELARLSKENEELREKVSHLNKEESYFHVLFGQLNQINNVIITKFARISNKKMFKEENVELNLYDIFYYIYFELTDTLAVVSQYKLIYDLVQYFYSDEYVNLVIKDKTYEIIESDFIIQLQNLASFDLIDISRNHNDVTYIKSEKGKAFSKFLKRKQLLEGVEL